MFELLKNIWILARINSPISFDSNIHELKVENLILRQQLSTLIHKNKIKPKLTNTDRVFWVLVSQKISNWKELLVVVNPETVIRWHKKGFKFFWKIKSKGGGGRPKVNKEIRDLIIKMATENKWGAPRIHGELIHLGIDVSEATVSRYMPKKEAIPSQHQSWRTFLRNSMQDTISMDFFVIPTISFKILYGIVVLSHDRREILHLNVTYNPTNFWLMNQLKGLLWENEGRFKYLIRDNDSIYGKHLDSFLNSFGITDSPTSFRSPWQNPYCERVIGTIRRELLDHVIIFNESQARSLLNEFAEYYNKDRTHLSLDKDSPIGKAKFSEQENIQTRPILNGLHHLYLRSSVGDLKLAA